MNDNCILARLERIEMRVDEIEKNLMALLERMNRAEDEVGLDSRPPVRPSGPDPRSGWANTCGGAPIVALFALLLLCAPLCAQDAWPVYEFDDVYTSSGEANVDLGVFFDFEAPNENITQTCTESLYGDPWGCTGIWWTLKVRDDVTVIPGLSTWANALNGGTGPALWLVFDPPFEPLDHPGELWTYYFVAFDVTFPIEDLPMETGLIESIFSFDVFMDAPGVYDLTTDNTTITRPVVQPGGSTLTLEGTVGWVHDLTPPAGCQVVSTLDNNQGDTCRIAWRTFVRGDVNQDGGLGLSDVIFLNEYLFQSGPVPPCRMAADVNDDDSLSIADPIYLLAYLFQGGAAPPAPFPSCDVDPSDDGINPALSCLEGCVP